jgi:hypothetical protein
VAHWRLDGQLLKLCNCPTFGACDTYCLVAPQGSCESILAMRIQSGHFGGVVLDGLAWSAVIRWPGTFYRGNGTMDLYVDEAASPDQRRCLGQIIGGEAGGTFFAVLRAVVPTIHGPHYLPIQLELG